MKISAYLTSRNPIELQYPVEASIRSLFAFADEIIICDTSDKDDGTKELLSRLQKDFAPKEFKIINAPECDWTKPNHGIYDGITKGIARAACTGDYCFQLDLDEVVEQTPNIRQKIEKLASKLDKDNPSITSIVVEYWGSTGKVRCDINPWKERLSINDPRITHGIPGSYRKYIDGLMYAYEGTDGCNLIYKENLVTINHINFITPQIEDIRRKAAFTEDKNALLQYEKWVNNVGDKLPVIYHFSWYSIYQKMLKYKLFWNNSWLSLYNTKKEPGWNPFFNKPLNEVSDQEMIQAALKIEKETSGHIFHQPYVSNVSPKTNSIKFNKPMPDLIKDWAVQNKTPEL